MVFVVFQQLPGLRLQQRNPKKYSSGSFHLYFINENKLLITGHPINTDCFEVIHNDVQDIQDAIGTFY